MSYKDYLNSLNEDFKLTRAGMYANMDYSQNVSLKTANQLMSEAINNSSLKQLRYNDRDNLDADTYGIDLFNSVLLECDPDGSSIFGNCNSNPPSGMELSIDDLLTYAPNYYWYYDGDKATGGTKSRQKIIEGFEGTYDYVNITTLMPTSSSRQVYKCEQQPRFGSYNYALPNLKYTDLFKGGNPVENQGRGNLGGAESRSIDYTYAEPAINVSVTNVNFADPELYGECWIYCVIGWMLSSASENLHGFMGTNPSGYPSPTATYPPRWAIQTYARRITSNGSYQFDFSLTANGTGEYDPRNDSNNGKRWEDFMKPVINYNSNKSRQENEQIICFVASVFGDTQSKVFPVPES